VEPIGFLTAPVRRWPVIVPVVVVAVIVALLIPSGSSSAYSSSTWQANAQVGVNPPYPANKLGAKVGVRQLAFYAKNPAVLAAAAQQAGVTVTDKLKNSVIVSNQKKGAHTTILNVAVLQPTKQDAVTMTNDFADALGAFAQTQLANQNKTALSQVQAQITNLQAAIAALPVKPPPPTTTTLPKVPKPKTPKTTTTTTHPPTTTTSTTSHSHAAQSAGQRANATLTADASATTTSSTLLPLAGQPLGGGVTPTTTATGATVGGSTSPTLAGTTNTSIPNNAIRAERTVLAQELAHAIAVEQNLKAVGVPQSGYKVVLPAQGATAQQIGPTSSTLSNGGIRFLLGLLIGLLLGVLVTWLLDGFDRRIRTRRRAEEVFGLPIVAEVPAAPSGHASVIPVVDIVVDPYSKASEAYRQLHVAILTAPAVTWVKRGGFDQLAPAPAIPQPLPVGATVGSAGSGDAADVAEPVTGVQPAIDTTARLPVAVASPESPTRKHSRFSILITSPDDEPTRSLVVVNLAAVFAEAGDRVLVATTSGMRTEFEGNGRGPQAWQSNGGSTAPSDLVANARPSQIPGVSSLALGHVFSSPSRLALNVGGLVEASRDIVDVLLLEAPLLSTQDGAAMLPAVDLVVVVAECWRTTIAEGIRTQRLLSQRRPPVLGVVLTNSQPENALLDAGRNL
jgi:capsular polysaccharide biosynthesis protein/Mrp family chromosome partitioning ATPase